MKWMSRQQALEALGVKPQSLYAYASRGLVRAIPHPDDPRASLYGADDIARLAARKRSSRQRAAIAQAAIAWGEPVMDTALTGVDGGRLVYAGHDAVMLAEQASLEDVARLLWLDPDGLADGQRSRPPEHDTEKARLLAYLAQEAAGSTAAAAGPAEGWRLLQGFVDAACGTRGRGPVHDRLAAHWRAPGAADRIRRALVLVADHELNPSTFAARVAAGTGASLAACALAGLATLTGPRHGEASAAALRFLRSATAAAAAGDETARTTAIGRWQAGGRTGTGHPLYAGGDPRARALLDALAPDPSLAGVLSEALPEGAPAGNIDLALAALTVAEDLPDSAPFVLFAVGRMVGWVAHALEQSRSGQPIRPRARYAGQSVTSGN